MKLSDILKGVGLISNKNVVNNLNATEGGKTAPISGPEIDRVHQGYQYHHHHRTPYAHNQQMDLGLNPAAFGSSYHPLVHHNNMYGQRGFGLRLSGGSNGGAVGGHSGGGYSGHSPGYGHTGYGGYIGAMGGGGGSVGSAGNIDGGYDYGHFTGRQKSKGSSVMTALTLLSFFFFINLLQNCLREQMDAMNPTVMVMTAGVARNRLNKFAEVNSRETTDNVHSENLPSPLIVYENKDRILYPNATVALRKTKIESKLENAYIQDGNTFYQRIN